MRRVIVSVFMSLDGVIQAPGGPQEDPTGGFNYGGWTAPLADDVFGEEIGKVLSEPYDLLLGRKTYEIFAAHWPYAESGPDDSIARTFNSVTKYVATRRGIDLTWQNAVAIRDAARDVAKLKREEGPALLTQGSSDLIQTLLAADLVDEMNLFTFPIVLGPGKKVFAGGATPAAFRLVYSRVSPGGVIVARYQRAGGVEIGDFTLDPPTPAEVARREKWRRES